MKRFHSLRILSCGALCALVALRSLGAVHADTPAPLVDVWAWGANDRGQLGAVPANVTVPSPIHEARRWVAVSAGSEHTLALTETGEVFAWGENTGGQLGNGTTTDSRLPIRVPGLTGVTLIVAGGFHNLAYRAQDRTLWGWGSNSGGQIGQPTGTAASLVPVPISAPGAVQALAAGGVFSLLLTTSGEVFAWGSNSYGQLGLGDFVDRSTPSRVPLPSAALSVAAGASHALSALTDGQVYSWGLNVFGQLGRGVLGTPETGEPGPAPVIEVTDAAMVTAGDFHCLALTRDGHVWGWGYDTEGQVGIGEQKIGFPVLVPRILPEPDSVVAVDAGGLHSLALRANGDVWAWGNCQLGACGNNGRRDLHRPGKVLSVAGAVAISAGERHSLALAPPSPSTQVVAFGASGQSLESAPERPRTRTVPGLTDVIQLSSGFLHTLALDGEHRIWAWGDNAHGQLGTPGVGHDDPALVDLPLDGAAGFVAVAARAHHSLALRSDGVVWAWGDGTWGQLGVGTVNAVTPPTAVPGLPPIVSIAVGERHALALASPGSVWAWGQNREGQLGIPPTGTLTLLPVLVPGVTAPSLIAAGGFHSLAVNLQGHLSAWGSGYLGQLGRSSRLDSYKPVAVELPDDVTAVSAGRYHTLVVRAGGVVSAFGDNSECQTGAGLGLPGSPPVTVALGGPALAVQAGDYHGLALGVSGQVLGWGNDSGGQLGRVDLPLPHADCDVRRLPVSSVTALGAGLIQSTMAALQDTTPPPRVDASAAGTHP